MRTFLIPSSLLTFALLALSSRPAFADSTCSKDTDCVKGWTCQVSGSSGGCSAPACAPGEKCDDLPVECDPPQEFKSCRPAPCSSDSDCAAGMVCYTRTETDCPPIACAPGESCPAPRCEPTTESACVPRYLLPCTTASECGPGFSCEAVEECSCSGSSGNGSGEDSSGSPTPAPDAPSDDTPEPPAPTDNPSCTCEPSKELHCRAAIVTCAVDADCSNGWTCATVSNGSDCASTPEPAPAPGEDGGSAPQDDCAPSAPVKQCVPPYYALVGSVRGVDNDSNGSPTLGGSESGNGSAAPTAGTKDGAASSSGGCAVSHGHSSGSALTLLGLASVFGLLRRRRAA
jgi:hypothetical protein